VTAAYFDTMAAPPMDERVLEAMLPYFKESYGNPLSLHPLGMSARKAVEEARGRTAELIGAQAEEIIFTASGTESNNFALKGVTASYEKKGRHIVISAVEHHSVMNPAAYLERKGWEVSTVGVDETGRLDPDAVEEALRDDTVLVSVILGNNEIGTIQPLKEIAERAKARGVLVHADGSAAVGNIAVDVNDLGIDLLSISGYKFYGPKGVGALYLRRGTRITQLLHGGIQENGRRAGGDNVPGIVGLGTAAELARRELPDRVERVTALRNRLVKGITERIDHVRFNGHPDLRLPGNVNMAFEFVEGEALLLYLAKEGVYASSGSTCASRALKASHVLSAIGVPPQSCQGTLQLTLGKDNTDHDVDRVLAVLPGVIDKLRAMSPLYDQHRT